MFWIKLCPRCHGDLFDDCDQYGSFITCIQCGFSKDVLADTVGTSLVTTELVPAPVASAANGTRLCDSQGGRHSSKTFANLALLDSNAEAV